ncbi:MULTISPECIES: hypothetical protein [unclassified Duganella]|uniref:hypothetical protein n=1 Tax=unclassified Duganella TaxID=2636909 RepID=UPI00088D3F4B|nr:MULTISPECIES: hypothetical protein [unclassified Duganella]SDH35997.1 hypothetical protein SAMN05216320_112137 [Duganella sp. OV458]SDK52392.1 hypothetical protein SAMN05428973_112137 [Duganella sp. OV510]
MNVSLRSTGLAFVWLGLAFFILAASAAIALVGPLAGIAGVGLGGALLFFLILQFRTESNRNWFLWVIFILPLAVGFVRKVTGISLFGVWQMGVLALAMFGLAKFWHDIRREALLRGAMVAFVVFLAIGSLSTFFGRSQQYAAAYQIFSDLKPVVALALGYAFAWNSQVEKLLWFMVRWFWLPCLAMVAFEWVAPGIYFKIFASGQALNASVDPLGLLPSRAVGMFEHPSFLANTGATFGLLALGRSLMADEEHPPCWLAVCMNFLLIVCGVQRQEMVGFLVSGAMIFVLVKPKQMFARVVIGGALGLIASVIFLSVFQENLQKEAGQWGYGTVGALQQPRAQIFDGALVTAKTYYPLGSGFGTYGGAGAEKFDHSLYDRLGFNRYFWYGKQNYLMDTYWPNSLAETGFFGAFTLLLSYVLLWLYAIKRSVKELAPKARAYWLSTMAMMAYMIMLSFSSPAFQDIRLFSLSAMLFGIASTVSKEKQS